MTTITPPPFIPERFAVAPVRPLVYSDGITILEYLKELQQWINTLLITHVNEELEKFRLEVDRLIEEVTTQLTEQTDMVDAEIATMVEYVNSAVQTIINNSVEVQDAVVAAIMVDENSDTRTVTDQLYVAPARVDSIDDELTGRLSEAELVELIDTRLSHTNVKNFGAVGDGVADDTTAIRAALEASDAVYFPPGDYLITDTIVVDSNKSLLGAGKYVSTIIGGGLTTVSKPMISGEELSSSGNSSVKMSNQTIRHLAIRYPGNNRTEYPVIFMNAIGVVLDHVSIDRTSYGGNLSFNSVFFGRTPTATGGTWAARVTNCKFRHTGLSFIGQTDAFILDSEFNCIENPYAIRLETADGLICSRNQLINKILVAGVNGPLNISDNYFDGFYLHTIDTVLHGIEIDGVSVRDLRVMGNHFYELPGSAVVLKNGRVRQALISGNLFENGDIFKTGLEDVTINDSSTSYAVSVKNNIFRRDTWVSLVGGVASRIARISSDTNKAAPVKVVTAGASGNDGFTPVSVVSDNTMMFIEGYSTVEQSLTTHFENNHPYVRWPNSPVAEYRLTPRIAQSVLKNTLFVDSSDNKLKWRDNDNIVRTVTVT